ncbi:hypothetical protein CVT25_002905 [Psilocybe cyanescens]|uniref:FAD/NAD(P)-binding domain-containing protein n=1 Tax=Psilocybe cyanescens TaxID=93625 RepID=A0A409X629_PSICY|nr:hypothetical protein CVT25_002905 [Psilocybe cyanescens]
MASKKKIVIVGAGRSGSQLARALSAALNLKLYSLTLISSRDYFLHQPGSLRMLTSSRGDLEKDGKVIVPYDRLFLRTDVGEFVHAEIASIVPSRGSSKGGGKVVTNSGKEYEYTILVSPRGVYGKVRSISQRRRARRSSILANEFAGEIRDIYLEKLVTVIHRDCRLLSDVYPDKLRLGLQKNLVKRKIRLELNNQLNDIPSFPASGVLTDEGTTVEADLFIPTRGGRPNTSFIASSLGKEALTESGYVKVNPTLQLKDYADIFSMGDVLDWDEVKQLAKYGNHVKTVLKNVLSILEGKKAGARYKSMFEAILVSNGVEGGISYFKVLWGVRLGDRLTRNIKSDDLFVKRAAGTLGY